MNIIKTLSRVKFQKNMSIKYIYGLIESKVIVSVLNDTETIKVYGIIIEMFTNIDDRLVGSEKEIAKIISPNKESVMKILTFLYENNVSPIHLFDVLNDNMDKFLDKPNIEFNYVYN